MVQIMLRYIWGSAVLFGQMPKMVKLLLLVRSLESGRLDLLRNDSLLSWDNVWWLFWSLWRVFKWGLSSELLSEVLCCSWSKSATFDRLGRSYRHWSCVFGISCLSLKFWNDSCHFSKKLDCLLIIILKTSIQRFRHLMSPLDFHILQLIYSRVCIQHNLINRRSIDWSIPSIRLGLVIKWSALQPVF